MQGSSGGIVILPEDSKALAAAVIDLYKSPQKAELLGKPARQYALDNYAFEQALNRYEQLFSAVAQSH